jgi:putative NIF3 family GTP cyclohydrolase 1 type 2
MLIEKRLGRMPLLIGDPQQAIGQVAWCTGAAQGMLGDAIEAGATAYISGEISEPTVHLARETGTVYLAAGHHATERYGIQALGSMWPGASASSIASSISTTPCERRAAACASLAVRQVKHSWQDVRQACF